MTEPVLLAQSPLFAPLSDRERTRLARQMVRQRYEALEAHIRTHGEYELPEIVAVRSEGGLAAYLDWVHGETSE